VLTLAGVAASTEITCATTTVGLVTFPTVTAGTSNVVGTCAPGFAGAPLRNCSLAGAWVDVVAGSTVCTRTAALLLDGLA
jgi:hypothetical protein